MKLRKMAQEIIGTLEGNRFYAECPYCGEPLLLKDACLFYLDELPPEAEKLHKEKLEDLRNWRMELKGRRKEITRSSEVGSKAVNLGFIVERIVPCMKDFCFDRNDCRSLFDPIDYIIFEGLSEKGLVSKIFFIDIKTGKSRLKQVQREIRSLVEHKEVVLDTYKVEVSK